MSTSVKVGDAFNFRSMDAFQEYMRTTGVNLPWEACEKNYRVSGFSPVGILLKAGEGEEETQLTLTHNQFEAWMLRRGVGDDWIEWNQRQIVRLQTLIMLMREGAEHYTLPGVEAIANNQIKEWEREIVRRERSIADFKALRK